MENSPEHAKSRKHDDRLFVHDVEFIADRKHRKRGTGGEDGSLGDQRGARQGINDRLSLLGGFFGRDVRSVSL